MPFKIIRNDIVKMNTEAIVNTANDHVFVGTGCDSAVYKAAGYEELFRYRTEKIGFVPEGEAFLTPGFHLPTKYIIHAVSPAYRDGNQGEEEKLRSCYRKSLQIAKENNIKSISFPLISTGGFGYPKEEGMRIAVDEINAFLLRNDMLIYLVVFDTKATMLGEKLYPDLEAYIDHNYVCEKREEEYGDAYFSSATSGEDDYEAYLIPASNEAGTAKQHLTNAARVNNPNTLSCMTASELLNERERLDRRTRRCAETKASVPGNWLESNTVGECQHIAACFDFEGQHESKLEERMRHSSDTFSQYLMYLIRNKKMENADVYKRAIVDKKVFSKIKKNPDYHPQKLTALCLCVGAKLNLDEARDLLARAGYALSPCDKTDIIFSYFIENGIYDMIELDIQLEEHGLPCIIS